MKSKISYPHTNKNVLVMVVMIIFQSYMCFFLVVILGKMIGMFSNCIVIFNVFT